MKTKTCRMCQHETKALQMKFCQKCGFEMEKVLFFNPNIEGFQLPRTFDVDFFEREAITNVNSIDLMTSSQLIDKINVRKRQLKKCKKPTEFAYYKKEIAILEEAHKRSLEETKTKNDAIGRFTRGR